MLLQQDIPGIDMEKTAQKLQIVRLCNHTFKQDNALDQVNLFGLLFNANLLPGNRRWQFSEVKILESRYTNYQTLQVTPMLLVAYVNCRTKPSN